MLAGEVPFASANRGTMVSGKLDRVVQRCLSRSPSDRFPGPGELLRALLASSQPT